MIEELSVTTTLFHSTEPATSSPIPTGGKVLCVLYKDDAVFHWLIHVVHTQATATNHIKRVRHHIIKGNHGLSQTWSKSVGVDYGNGQNKPGMLYFLSDPQESLDVTFEIIRQVQQKVTASTGS